MTESNNIYAYAREQIRETHAERITGNASGVALVVFTTPLNAAATNALQKSFAAIGFGADACTFADLNGLGPEDVFDVVEGIDPVVLVAADGHAATLCAQAVAQEFPLMKNARLFGREARAFEDLNSMLGCEDDRQAVWRLLKTLA